MFRDNGILKQNHYENGVLRFTGLSDEGVGPDGVKNWHIKTTDFDTTGTLISKFTQFDNGDTTSFTFTDGVRTAKWDMDGDNSEDWFVRETIYGADQEVVEVNTYDAWPVLSDDLALA